MDVTITNRSNFPLRFSVFTLYWPPSATIAITPSEAAYAQKNCTDYQIRMNSGWLLNEGVDRYGRILIRNTKPVAVRLRVPRLALAPGENIVSDAVLDEIFSLDKNLVKIFAGLQGQPDGLEFVLPDWLVEKYGWDEHRDNLVQLGQTHFPEYEAPLAPEQNIPEKTEKDLPRPL